MNKMVRQTTDNAFALQHSVLIAINFNLYHLTGIHNYKKSKKVSTKNYFKMLIHKSYNSIYLKLVNNNT